MSIIGDLSAGDGKNLDWSRDNAAGEPDNNPSVTAAGTRPWCDGNPVNEPNCEPLAIGLKLSMASGGRDDHDVQVASFDFVEDDSRLGVRYASVSEDGSHTPWSYLDREAGSDHIHPTFIEAPPKTNRSLLYAIERKWIGTDQPSEMNIRFKLFEKGVMAETGWLTRNGGNPAPWFYENRKSVRSGDYMGGASYQSDDETVFVAAWVESDVLFFNTVTVKFADKKAVIYGKTLKQYEDVVGERKSNASPDAVEPEEIPPPFRVAPTTRPPVR